MQSNKSTLFREEVVNQKNQEKVYGKILKYSRSLSIKLMGILIFLAFLGFVFIVSW